ncbi:hypothetical protein GCM10010176_078950 [Nonomuraea spiralis]|nr:hypothetical protein GCM10010176_078950 [Nonomuraea spiralis]
MVRAGRDGADAILGPRLDRARLDGKASDIGAEEPFGSDPRAPHGRAEHLQQSPG